MADIIRVFADGSCYPNPGPGGWACIVVRPSGRKVLTGGENPSSNNRMELSAVLGGLCDIEEPSEVEVVSDSQYVTKVFTDGWLRGWKSSGKFGTDRLTNNDLWVALDSQARFHRKVIWTWVRGHNGHRENEEVDRLAGEARRRFEG